MSTASENATSLSWRASYPRADVLGVFAIAIGLCWSVLFIVVGLGYALELYADGSLFSYAVAVQDVWAFHWHNIPERLSVFLFCLWPAEIYVGLTGEPHGGVVLYGLLFYSAPLMGLIGTFAADRSRGRVFFTYGCLSTALLCPLVFGFPTEMWLAHALFWPTLCVSYNARRSMAQVALMFVLLLTLVLSHEGGIILGLAIVMTLALRGFRDAAFLRAVVAFIAATAIWVAVKWVFRPDDYFAEMMVRAAGNFFDPTIFKANLVEMLFCGLLVYGIALIVLRRLAPASAYIFAVGIVVALLCVYWFWFDNVLHASNRYYLRTALVILVPMLGALAALRAMEADGTLKYPVPFLTQTMTGPTRQSVSRAFAGALLLVTLIHAVETGQFVMAWTRYEAAVRKLATGSASDPSLGDARFVSSQRIGADLNRLSWFSTTEYLSVLLADFKPTRLVVDPTGNYFWLSCETATANTKAARAVPEAARELVRVYSCLHR